MGRGYFEIGILRGKTVENVGTLWRSAFQLGAAGIFTVGQRYRAQASDTVRASRHVPLREFADFDAFLASMPNGAQLVGVEMGGRSLPTFTHPDRAVYLLGSEDSGLSQAVMTRCHHVISLPALRTESYNVAVAGSLVMYDRNTKRLDWGATTGDRNGN
jgi:tRNA G18 (ribose-2'-O)-methylase SpoU